MNYWFQATAFLIFCVFISIMVLVVSIAFSRQSGKTGMDMGKVQQMRYEG